MNLTVIILNYNVRYFLEQALKAVKEATLHATQHGFIVETIVVDNDSKDGSVEMVQMQFPAFQLIANKENVGFSAGNNQGIKIAKGDYVLLLNPDTVVSEDTFTKILQFVEKHPDCGGLGVKMIDGKGIFLPESKRGLPTPMVSLYKMTGLSSLFSNSPRFNQYHLGFLDKNQTHKVAVLSGAFMLLKKECLDKIGLLDETFFMYGEDIDLSYRITKGGFENYYFADTTIIHYKGESTKKGSLNYVRIFYNAMIIFAQKHFANQQAGLYTLLIRVGIYLRASLSILARIVRWAFPILLDAFIVLVGLYFIKEYWANNVKGMASYYAPQYMTVNVPLYIFIWLTSVYFSGGYDKPFKLSRLIRGLFVGTLIISAVYGFLDEAYRFSRAMILLGAIWSIFALSALRIFTGFFRNKSFDIAPNDTGKLAIVGGLEEGQHIKNLLSDTGLDFEFMGWIDPSNLVEKKHRFRLGDLENLAQIIELYKIKEIIFCRKDVSFKRMIEAMEAIGPAVNYKIVTEDSDHIIGSNSKNKAGDLYTLSLSYTILQAVQKRNKRLLDFVLSLIFLITFPIGFLLVKNPIQFFKNSISILLNQKTWVGFSSYNFEELPKIKESILSEIDKYPDAQFDEMTTLRLLKLYAKEYSVYKDVEIIFKAFRSLGKK